MKPSPSARNSELNGVAWLVLADEIGKGASGTDFDTVDCGDDIFVFKTGFSGGTVFDDGRITRGTIKIDAFADGKIVVFGYFGSDFDTIDAKIGATGFAGLDELV